MVKARDIIFLVLGLVLGIAGVFSYQPVDITIPKISEKPTVNACGASQNTIVTKVIDGDTVVVQGGFHVRLLGIDADEKNYPCYDAARLRLEQLVLGKPVQLQKDATDIDQYGRCLRMVYAQGQNIGVQLAQEGLAVARFYPPDVQYQHEVAKAEATAIENKVGCKWK